MKQKNDESIKENEKIQQFLVWLHEKTTSLGSHYQESALRAFYCDVVARTQSVNREISRMLDSKLDEGLYEVRGIAHEVNKLVEFDGIFCRSKREQREIGQLLLKVKQMPAVDIFLDRDLALFCTEYERETSIYLHGAIALLIGLSSLHFQEQSKSIGFLLRESDKQLLEEMFFLKKIFSDRDEQADRPSTINLKEWKRSISLCLHKYRNLKLDWQFSDEQKQLLNKYYAANLLIVSCLQKSNASPEVQKEIQDTLLLPIVEIERRKSGITRKIVLDCLHESNAIPEVKETQETLFLPTVEIEICSSNEVQRQVQKMLPSPIDEIPQHQQVNKQSRPNFSVNTEFYTTSLLYSSLLIALILYIVFITIFKHYIWIL
jgi:hypothetical protein